MKKISLTRQLKAANEQVVKLQLEVEAAEKKAKSAEDNRNYYSKVSTDRQIEIDAVNMLLDALPNPPPSKTTADYPKDLSIATRIAVWLASR